MAEKASLQSRLRKINQINEMKNCLLDEIKHNYLMSEDKRRHVSV